jgi:hypothetical protein
MFLYLHKILVYRVFSSDIRPCIGKNGDCIWEVHVELRIGLLASVVFSLYPFVLFNTMYEDGSSEEHWDKPLLILRVCSSAL